MFQTVDHLRLVCAFSCEYLFFIYLMHIIMILLGAVHFYEYNWACVASVASLSSSDSWDLSSMALTMAIWWIVSTGFMHPAICTFVDEA